MTTNITAALLGVTRPHSLAHLRTLQALPEIGQILLWDEDAQALEQARAAQPAKIAQVSTDLDALLGRGDMLFAIVCVPTDSSAELCERALAASIHVLAEKTDWPQRRRGRARGGGSRAGRAAAGVCYQNRYHPIVREARQLVGQGLIGPLVSVEMRMLTTRCASATRRAGCSGASYRAAACSPGWAATTSI